MTTKLTKRNCSQCIFHHRPYGLIFFLLERLLLLVSTRTRNHRPDAPLAKQGLTFRSTMDARLGLFFVLATVHACTDAFVFQDWSLLLLAVALGRIMTGLLLPSEYLPQAMVLFLLGHSYYWLDRMPFIWESNFWSAQVDLAIATWLALYGNQGISIKSKATENADSLEFLVRTIHELYASFYLAAGFWKINSHFLDPPASCATVFFCQHISYYTSHLCSWETQVALAKVIAPWASLLTLMLELSMGLALSAGVLLPHRKMTRVGLMLILFFHLMVCVTPRPNDISNFGLQCAVRLSLLLDRNSIVRVASRLRPHRVSMACVTIVAVAYGVQKPFTPLNWSFLLYIPIFGFFHACLLEEEACERRMAADACKAAQSTDQSSRRPWWTLCFSAFAAFYAFGAIPLGIMEEFTCNMFSNLRIHGGSNHLLLPTGLVFDWYRDAGDAHPYGGGEIRIEETTSHWLRSIYPNDLSHVMQPVTASKLLEESMGSPSPNFFNAGANRVLGLRERGWVPPPPHGMMIQYSVPGLEWKRLLREAMEKDKSFHVVYAHLPGSRGDEIWRAMAWERRVVLQVSDQTIEKCTVQYPNNTQSMCSSGDLPYHLVVPWWYHKIGLYHGYPILRDHEGNIRPSIQCFGP